MTQIVYLCPFHVNLGTFPKSKKNLLLGELPRVKFPEDGIPFNPKRDSLKLEFQ